MYVKLIPKDCDRAGTIPPGCDVIHRVTLPGNSDAIIAFCSIFEFDIFTKAKKIAEAFAKAAGHLPYDPICELVNYNTEGELDDTIQRIIKYCEYYTFDAENNPHITGTEEYPYFGDSEY